MIQLPKGLRCRKEGKIGNDMGIHLAPNALKIQILQIYLSDVYSIQLTQ